MLSALKFVQGAVARKDYVQALTHFRIENGMVKGFNGMLGLCGPIDLDLSVTPRAVQFVKAIQACQETISMHLTESGKLSIKSGRFKAFVECISEPWPGVEPEGEEVTLDGTFLDTLKILAPFIADDASRPWARGILFRGSSAFATNNVILAERWLGFNFPIVVNVPKTAVTELLRINEEPERLQVTGTSVTFHYPGKRWLRTQTYSLEWPDLSSILDAACSPAPLPPGFFEAIDDLAPFANDAGEIHFKDSGVMTTSAADGIGASVQLDPFGAVGIYNVEQLRRLVGVVDKIDMSRYPRPAIFYSDRLRGAVIGMRPSAA